MKKIILGFISVLFLLQSGVVFAAPSVNENSLFKNYNYSNAVVYKETGTCLSVFDMVMAVGKVASIGLLIIFFLIYISLFVFYGKRNKKNIKYNARLSYFFSTLILVVYIVIFLFALTVEGGCSNCFKKGYDLILDFLLGIFFVVTPILFNVFFEKYFLKNSDNKKK